MLDDNEDEIFHLNNHLHGGQSISLHKDIAISLRAAFAQIGPKITDPRELLQVQINAAKLWLRWVNKKGDPFDYIFGAFRAYGIAHGQEGIGPKFACMIQKLNDFADDDTLSVDTFIEEWYRPVKKKRRAVKFYSDVMAKEMEREPKRKFHNYPHERKSRLSQ